MMDFTLMYPCHDGWDAQGNHDGGACDIGWTSLKTSPEYGSKDGKTDIYAAADGIVEFEGWYPQSYGGRSYNTICAIIRHPGLDEEKDIISIYFHLSRTLCNKGDVVKMGDVIGRKGNTGNSRGVHLHFQTMAIPKGMEIPDNSDGGGWKQWSFYPVPYMRQYPNTYFKSVGNWTIPLAEDTDGALSRALAMISKMESELASLKGIINVLGGNA